MRITKVSRQKKNPNRLSIFADGRFVLSADEEAVVSLDLREGREIDESDLLRVREADSDRRSLETAFRLLKIRSRSLNELRERLIRKHFPSDSIDRAIERARQMGYLDDEKFSLERIRSLREKGKGPFLIRAELRKAGIDDEKINEYLARPDEGSGPDSERIRDIALTRLKRMKGLDDATAARRLTGFLSRRGFDIETIKEGLRLARIKIKEEE